jgi:hypothetical protein
LLGRLAVWAQRLGVDEYVHACPLARMASAQ